MLELEVPFTEKDLAKNLGARWNPVRKKWYVPQGVAVEPFSRWLTTEDSLQVTEFLTRTEEQNLPIEKSNFPNAVEIEKKDNLDSSKLLLSEFLQKVSAVISIAMPETVWVVAEISEIKQRNGNYFLTLVEYQAEAKTAQATARIWQSQVATTAAKFKQATGSELEPGIKVLMLVAANFHPQYGFSLTINDIDPSYTLGDMAAKLAKIREQLQKENIVERNKQLTKAKDFDRVAVISPEQAAGLGDFKREANILHKHKLCEFKYYEATFQGKIAAQSIIKAIKQVIKDHANKPFDALVIIRGGGAVADLAWLNDLELAQAICLAPLAVITGIGHERDHTIVDEVANLKLDTPSKVINYIFQRIVQNSELVEQAFREISFCARNIIATLNNQLEILNEKIISEVFKTIKTSEYETQSLLEEIYAAAPKLCKLAENEVERLLQEIIPFGPGSVLKRGFALVRTADEHLITSAVDASMHVGESFNLKFYDGEVEAKFVAQSED